MMPQSSEWRDEPQDEAALAREIAGLRPALRGYVLSILPHHGACDDVVQETCLFLWERRGECGEETNLKAWAFRVAWFKAMAWRRDRQRERERTVSFSEDSLHEIAGAAEALADEAQDRLRALRSCLARLSPEEIRLLRLRYVEGGSHYVRGFHADGRLDLLVDGKRVTDAFPGFRWEVSGGVLKVGVPGEGGVHERHVLRDRQTLVFVSNPYGNAVRLGIKK